MGLPGMVLSAIATAGAIMYWAIAAQTVFKQRLIRCAESLDVSIQEIGFHIDRRATKHISNYGLRDDQQI